LVQDVDVIDDIGEQGDGWLEDYLPYQLYRATNRLHMRLQSRLRAIGMNPSQWRVMSVLRSMGTMTIGRIAENALMEQPTVSRIVLQLEQEGLVQRRPSSDDSRMTDVALTRSGMAASNKICPAACRHQQLALEGFSEQEIEMLRDMLRRIETNIDLYD